MTEGDADEIYWVNKLLAIEDLDWSRQLSQAVSALHIFIFLWDMSTIQFVHSKLKMLFCYQGFRDTSLSVWDVSCILKRYEEQTGHVLTHGELDSGYLKNQLIDSDYDLEGSVSFWLYLTW